MPDKKLTDKEIVEDLKIYCKGECAYCGRVDEDLNLATDNALDLINHLQEKVGELEIKNSELKYDLSLIRQEREEVVKAEAYKEYHKRFEKNIKDVEVTLGQTWEIQNALKKTYKEMVGEDNG